MAQPLREAIRTAIEQALEVRGCYHIELERDSELRGIVTAAVDGSLEVVVNGSGPRTGLLRRKRKPLDRYEMAAIGFQEDRGTWWLAVPAGPGAADRVADAIERLFTGPFERALDDGAELWFDHPGLVPGRPVTSPDAPHVEHLEAAMAIFELDPEADVLISAGLPSVLHLEYSLAGDDRVEVHVMGRDGPAEHDRATFPATAAALLHDDLGVGEGEPLFVYLSSDALP